MFRKLLHARKRAKNKQIRLHNICQRYFIESMSPYKSDKIIGMEVLQHEEWETHSTMQHQFPTNEFNYTTVPAAYAYRSVQRIQLLIPVDQKLF